MPKQHESAPESELRVAGREPLMRGETGTAEPCSVSAATQEEGLEQACGVGVLGAGQDGALGAGQDGVLGAGQDGVLGLGQRRLAARRRLQR